MDLTAEDLDRLFRSKYGDSTKLGWGLTMRRSRGYFNPDDIYEASIAKLVKTETRWLDVGCGKDLFPSNASLARLLADRCELLVGLDPSDNVEDNSFVDEYYKTTIQDFKTVKKFDLITLRMVAEHIVRPEESVRSLSSLTEPGGMVIVYTVYKWSPVTILSGLLPFQLHHRIKKLFWHGAEEDTFPTAYLMNTRRTLAAYFLKYAFYEDSFSYLDDCRTLSRWKNLNRLELLLWKLLRFVKLRYPELCILGAYRRK